MSSTERVFDEVTGHDGNVDWVGFEDLPDDPHIQWVQEWAHVTIPISYDDTSEDIEALLREYVIALNSYTHRGFRVRQEFELGYHRVTMLNRDVQIEVDDAE